MKVILLQDITRVGRKFEVKDVPSGHALNYLIPRKLAEPATPQNMKKLELRAEKLEAEQSANEEQFKSLLKTLTQKHIAIAVKANEQGHLFKGLHETDIAHELEKIVGVSVSPNTIVIERPIKEVGEYIVSLSMGSRKGEVPITVTAVGNG